MKSYIRAYNRTLYKKGFFEGVKFSSEELKEEIVNWFFLRKESGNVRVRNFEDMFLNNWHIEFPIRLKKAIVNKEIVEFAIRDSAGKLLFMKLYKDGSRFEICDNFRKIMYELKPFQPLIKSIRGNADGKVWKVKYRFNEDEAETYAYVYIEGNGFKSELIYKIFSFEREEDNLKLILSLHDIGDQIMVVNEKLKERMDFCEEIKFFETKST